jgi:hypothetical protein
METRDTKSFQLNPHAKDPRLPKWAPWLILLAFIGFCFLILWLKR